MIGQVPRVKRRMSSSFLVPQPFWFRVALSCRHVAVMPRIKGRPLDLPDACTLLDQGSLSGVPGWVSVQAGWNDKGLGLAFTVDRPSGTTYRPNAKVVPTVMVWVDTRDTRTVHRATRFCHKFEIKLTPQGVRDFEVRVTQPAIPRALADSPKVHVGAVQTWAEGSNRQWSLEVFFPSDALAGFDPDSNRRFGLFYQVTDPDRGDHFSGVGREFPVGEDPSLWATLTLEDPT